MDFRYLLFIVEEPVNGLHRHGPCISNIKMCQFLKFRKKLTFDCPVPNFLLVIVLGGYQIFMPISGEVLLTPAVNYVRFLIFNQELNSREV